MTQETTALDWLPADAPLPRGRNGLPREFVLAHQRERILAATAEVLDRVGYPALTVQPVIGTARVSRKTFYDIFESKLQCVIAAYDHAFAGLVAAIEAACEGAGAFEERLSAAVAAALSFAAERPHSARLLAVHAMACEPRLARHALASRERLAAMLCQGRELGGSEQPEGLEQMLVGGVMALVGERLARRGADPRSLHPDVCQLLLAPYVGIERARRLVPGPPAGGAAPRQLQSNGKAA